MNSFHLPRTPAHQGLSGEGAHMLAKISGHNQAHVCLPRAPVSKTHLLTGSPNKQAHTCPPGAPASRGTSWYLMYQPSKQVSLLAELVPVPAQRAGQPARQAGTCTSPARRSY
ncbi:hypothetical protein PCASD_14761 [Puccinia coronata f. sp. avenae]|uniref:Uncharacterized protein n=1 Tax=Puccinia coronata f. sp. avenae TaxID=200324 RepID=A0A2N5UAZ7_9BASI|nr:hypothetical protein PCASD_14761 [Puccinia coronata f. sp. avenae]